MDTHALVNERLGQLRQMEDSFLSLLAPDDPRVQELHSVMALAVQETVSRGNLRLLQNYVPSTMRLLTAVDLRTELKCIHGITDVELVQGKGMVIAYCRIEERFRNHIHAYEINRDLLKLYPAQMIHINYIYRQYWGDFSEGIDPAKVYQPIWTGA